MIIALLIGAFFQHKSNEYRDKSNQLIIERNILKKEISELKDERDNTWRGVASYYSEEGCVGCRDDLLMANGERFRDEGFTVAFNQLPLESWVTIENMKTGDMTYARVTDTGGFEPLGRIVDISPAVKNAINCEDLCQVEIRKL